MDKGRLTRVLFLLVAVGFCIGTDTGEENEMPEDYRSQDREWCHGNDFWSGEVTGIYRFNGRAWVLSDEETTR
jgi:hypothetical protein